MSTPRCLLTHPSRVLGPFAAMVLSLGTTVLDLRGATKVDIPMEGAVATDGRRLDEAPRLVSRDEGTYPRHMIANENYLFGIVKGDIELGADGIVSGFKVTYASHPAFVPAALTQVMASRFLPGKIDGKPVASVFGFMTTYDVRNRFGKNIGGDVYRSPLKVADAPPEYDYDGAPFMYAFCEPAYPRDLLEKKIKGEATVRMIVSEKGQVESATVLEATSPEFGAALVAAVETWGFYSATRGNKPSKAMIDQRYKFLPFGFRRPDAENQALKQMKRGGKAFVTAESLDAPLKTVFQVKPRYPCALSQTAEHGEAVVDFVVCENGEVALPAIVSATKPEFGYAAVNAISQWVFMRPVSRGKPTMVRTRMTFTFVPESSSAGHDGGGE